MLLPAHYLLGKAAEELYTALRVIGGTTDEVIADVLVSDRVMDALGSEAQLETDGLIVRTTLGNVVVRRRSKA